MSLHNVPRARPDLLAAHEICGRADLSKPFGVVTADGVHRAYGIVEDFE